MPRRIALFLALSLPFILTSCKLKELVVQTAAASSHDAKDHAGVSGGVVGVAGSSPTVVDGYTAPADGRLTGQQVQNFIKIRQRARQYEEAGRHDLEQRAKDRGNQQPNLGDVIGMDGALSNVVAADSKASKDLGYNAGEYEWVKQQMLDASMATVADRGKVTAAKLAEQERAALQRSLDTAPDESSREIYRGMMADAEKTRKEALAAEVPETPAVTYNKHLIAQYEDASRPLLELVLGGTGHEAEITKGISDLQKTVDGTP